MTKIRINELARELEVKPNVILDMLRELGVADKKTHSSSLDDDVALEVRRRVAAENAAPGLFDKPASNGASTVEAEPEAARPPAAAETARPQAKTETAPAAK